MPVDDPIAEALTSDSAYERLRAREFGVLRRAIHEKLAWQSYLLLALAALLPLAAFGANPFEQVPDAVSIGTLAITAMVGAVVLKFLSAYVYAETLRREDPAVRGGY